MNLPAVDASSGPLPARIGSSPALPNGKPATPTPATPATRMAGAGGAIGIPDGAGLVNAPLNCAGTALDWTVHLVIYRLGNLISTNPGRARFARYLTYTSSPGTIASTAPEGSYIRLVDWPGLQDWCNVPTTPPHYVQSVHGVTGEPGPNLPASANQVVGILVSPCCCSSPRRLQINTRRSF